MLPVRTLKPKPPSGPVLLVIGTRPDTIKLIPLYRALRKRKIPTLLCSTGQHAEILDNLLTLFQVQPDFDFNIMKENQDLFHSTIAILEQAKELFLKIKPSLVVVQGDTTSAMSAALAAFYLKIPIAHVEAGLRTKNIHRPFPEELNRRIIALIASVHFAPTIRAVAHLLSEGIPQKHIFRTGNTVVDALYFIQDEIAKRRIMPTPAVIDMIQKLRANNRTILLLTAHRRESFDGGLDRVFFAIQTALKRDPNLHVIFPQHPNPAIQKILQKTKLHRMPNIQIIAPLPYQDLVYVLGLADCVATDSGGIQEEAVSLNKPVLVLRRETDRPEGIEEGGACLVGTDPDQILSAIARMAKKQPQTSRSRASLYGDGQASQKIARIIHKFLKKRSL